MPALSAEEWETAQLWNAGKLPGGKVRGYGMYNPAARPENKHGLAALALHGQPFGFTWGDVDAIRGAADDAESEARPYPEGCAEACAPFDSLADRIAALLPPREMTQ